MSPSCRKRFNAVGVGRRPAAARSLVPTVPVCEGQSWSNSAAQSLAAQPPASLPHVACSCHRALRSRRRISPPGPARARPAATATTHVPAEAPREARRRSRRPPLLNRHRILVRYRSLLNKLGPHGPPAKDASPHRRLLPAFLLTGLISPTRSFQETLAQPRSDQVVRKWGAPLDDESWTEMTRWNEGGASCVGG